MIIPVFPNGKEKCLTLSYDDGVTQDRKLVEILNKYGIKCTFNLNSGAFGLTGTANGPFVKETTHNKIEASEVSELYKGHEVAVHSLTHPHLEYLTCENIAYEIRTDKEKLEKLVGYPITGMAYPFGTYSSTLIEELKKAGIKYARTVVQTNEFIIPKDFLEWHPTCHFGEKNMQSLVDRFLDAKKDSDYRGYLKVFYVWGHAYELDGCETWDLMEDFCKQLSNKEDVWYATNGEIVEYYEAWQRLIWSEDKSMVTNPSALSVWIEADGEVMEIPGGSMKKICSL